VSLTCLALPHIMGRMATETPLGTRIKRARERKRWTQQQLAKAIGVDRKSVDNWENDRTQPRSSLGALEEVLGPLTGEDRQARIIAPALRRVIREQVAFGQISEEDARRVTGLLEGTLRWPDDPAQAGPAVHEAEEDGRSAG
jgi:transcriptional regulator with XRE-family HTH domain